MKNKKFVNFLLRQAKSKGIKDDLTDYINEILCANKVEIVYYNGYWSIENVNTCEVIIDEESLDTLLEGDDK